MFIVEHELGRFVLSCLQEAHHLAIIGGLPIARLLAAYLGNQTVGHYLRLKVRRRAALGDWQVRRIPQRIDVRLPLHLQRGAIRGQPALLITQT